MEEVGLIGDSTETLLCFKKKNTVVDRMEESE